MDAFVRNLNHGAPAKRLSPEELDGLLARLSTADPTTSRALQTQFRSALHGMRSPEERAQAIARLNEVLTKRSGTR